MITVRFDSGDFEREIMRELEKEIRSKLKFPGSGSLTVRVSRTSRDEMRIAISGRDEKLVAEAEKRLGISRSPSRPPAVPRRKPR